MEHIPPEADAWQGTDIDTEVRAAAAALARSRSTLVFTGAGISVESGIAPFRGAGGVWERYDPRCLDLEYFAAEPSAAWEAIRSIFYEAGLEAEPNPAHCALADWERRGLVDLLVTQNIDGLHRRAGSRKLVEFHGSIDTLVCQHCGARRPAFLSVFGGLPPRCACGGVWKPDFVFFGEGIPPAAYESAFAAADRAEVCLVVGTTGTVQPAAFIPRRARNAGAFVIEVNPESSELTYLADAFIPLKASEALRAIDAALGGACRSE